MIAFEPMGLIRSPFTEPNGMPIQPTSAARGLFAPCAPRRPNAFGLSAMKLNRIEDGPPLLDIKPCVPEFDTPPDVHTGWLEQEKHKVSQHETDDRFTEKHETRKR